MQIPKFLKFFTREAPQIAPTDDYWYSAIGKIVNGVNVTPDMALQCSAVFSCVRVLAETIAGLPFILYTKSDSGRTRDTKHPLYRLIHDTPNKWMTSFEYREMCMGHLLLRGNAYSQKIYNGKNEIVELIPLDPSRMTVVMSDDGSISYHYSSRSRGKIVFPQDRIFHLKAYSNDGIIGMSLISQAAESIGLSISAEKYASRMFENDATPGGILSHPGKLTDEVHKRIKNSWNEAHKGVEKSHNVAIIEEGMKWEKIGMSPEDMQFIASRKFQLEEIARIFRIPPHLIGHLEKATFSNIEHQSLEFVQHTILPWLRRWEQAIAARLLTEQEAETKYVEFLVDGLLRGDLESRYRAYAVGRQWGWLSANDILKMENRDPIGEKGDIYLVPLNMVDAKDAGKQQDTNNSATGNTIEPVKQPQNTQSKNSLVALESFTPILKHLMIRAVERVKKSGKSVSEHRDIIKSGFEAAIQGLFMLSNNRDPIIQTDVSLRHFFNVWEREKIEDAEKLVSKLIETVAQVNEIPILTLVKDTESLAPVINIEVKPADVNVTLEKKKTITELEYVYDKNGKRKTRLKEVDA